MGKINKTGALIALLLAGGAAVYWVVFGNGSPSEALAPGGAYSVIVEAVPVRQGELVRSVDTIGTLMSEESITLRPELSGRVVTIGFEEGQPVEKGQLLVALDDSIYRAELAETKASLALSKANYERAKELATRGAASKRARDEAVAAMRRDEASVALARARLDKTKITAPHAGIVGLRKVGVGDYVSPGQELVGLDVVNPIKIDFKIPELYLSSLREGLTVEFDLDALPGKTYTGAVYAIDPQVDINGRSLAVRAKASNEDGILRPGLFARVELILERQDGALFVPEEALVPQGSDHFIYKIDGGKALWTRIAIGYHKGNDVQVLSGLQLGDIVITSGQMKLRDGAMVSVRSGGEE